MKYLLFALCLPLTTNVCAQQCAALPPTSSITYCMLEVSGDYFSSVKLSLDYGQRSKLAVLDVEMAMVAEQVRRIDSVPAALNYLHGFGWDCVQAATLPNENSSHYIQGEIGYLLRRHTP